MSDTFFTESPAHQFLESPAHQRDTGPNVDATQSVYARVNHYGLVSYIQSNRFVEPAPEAHRPIENRYLTETQRWTGYGGGDLPAGWVEITETLHRKFGDVIHFKIDSTRKGLIYEWRLEDDLTITEFVHPEFEPMPVFGTIDFNTAVASIISIEQTLTAYGGDEVSNELSAESYKLQLTNGDYLSVLSDLNTLDETIAAAVGLLDRVQLNEPDIVYDWDAGTFNQNGAPEIVSGTFGYYHERASHPPYVTHRALLTYERGGRDLTGTVFRWLDDVKMAYDTGYVGKRWGLSQLLSIIGYDYGDLNPDVGANEYREIGCDDRTVAAIGLAGISVIVKKTAGKFRQLNCVVRSRLDLVDGHLHPDSEVYFNQVPAHIHFGGEDCLPKLPRVRIWEPSDIGFRFGFIVISSSLGPNPNIRPAPPCCG